MLAARVGKRVVSVRTVLFPTAAPCADLPDVMLGDPETGSGLDGPGPEGIPAAGKAPCHRSFCTLWQAGGQRGLTEVIAPPTFHIVLFGAGHVGQALVNIRSEEHTSELQSLMRISY